jgi:hypothetical protein
MLGNLGSADLRISHRPTQTGKERRLEGEKVRRLEEQMADGGGQKWSSLCEKKPKDGETIRRFRRLTQIKLMRRE